MANENICECRETGRLESLALVGTERAALTVVVRNTVALATAITTHDVHPSRAASVRTAAALALDLAGGLIPSLDYTGASGGGGRGRGRGPSGESGWRGSPDALGPRVVVADLDHAVDPLEALNDN